MNFDVVRSPLTGKGKIRQGVRTLLEAMLTIEPRKRISWRDFFWV